MHNYTVLYLLNNSVLVIYKKIRKLGGDLSPTAPDQDNSKYNKSVVCLAGAARPHTPMSTIYLRGGG